MTHSRSIILLSILFFWPVVAQEKNETTAQSNWPQWRGPLSTGVAPDANPPMEWSEDKNVQWKTELPGKGHSTPIVWGDRIFVTTAIPHGEALEPKYADAFGGHNNLPVTHRQKFVVLALSRVDARIIWQRTLHAGLPHEGGHSTASFASNSPVTDGEHLFAFFGSNGLYALDLDGGPLWTVDLGNMETKHGHGEGSSPALYGDILIINWDHEGGSFLAAFDKRTGAELWRVERDEVTSWATPIVVEHEAEPQVIVCGTERVRGYELASGKVIWECRGLSANIVASPVAADGLVFAGSSYDTRAFLAIRLAGAHGDISGTEQVVWARRRGTPYVPSPLLYGNALYFLNHYQGVLTRVHAKTGEDQPGTFRVAGVRNVYASPAGAAGRVYVTGLGGTTTVISDQNPPILLAVNRLDDSFSASAAIAGNQFFLRGEKYLYCIAE
jgi:outer membrane protein assembly factor BamB